MNTQVHDTTKHSPYELVFGQPPRSLLVPDPFFQGHLEEGDLETSEPQDDEMTISLDAGVIGKNCSTDAKSGQEENANDENMESDTGSIDQNHEQMEEESVVMDKASISPMNDEHSDDVVVNLESELVEEESFEDVSMGDEVIFINLYCMHTFL